VVLVPVREQKSGAWVWNEQRMQQLVELLQAEKVTDIKPFPQTLTAVTNKTTVGCSLTAARVHQYC
jgi:hypothetical protein